MIKHKAGALSGHLKGHKGWTKVKYIKTFGEQSADDFADYIPPLEQRQASSIRMFERNTAKNRPVEPIDYTDDLSGAINELNAANRNQLSYEEAKFFDKFVEHIVQQTDRDDTQMPIITGLAFDMVFLDRLRNFQLRRGRSEDGIAANKDFDTTVKQVQDRIGKTMDMLGVSRSEQIKRGQIIKSSPASLISGYLDEIERMSPEVLRALILDEKRIYARSHARVQQFILSKAAEIEKEEESDETGRPLSLQDALSRAGLTAGGSSGQAQRVEPVTPTGPSESQLPF
jgi:hypothetical protein